MSTINFSESTIPQNYAVSAKGATNSMVSNEEAVWFTEAVIAGVSDDKGNMVCACSKAAQAQGAHAGKIVQRIAAITGGKGGGRPDSAMAGVGQTYMIDEALMSLESIVNDMIQK